MTKEEMTADAHSRLLRALHEWHNAGGSLDEVVDAIREMADARSSPDEPSGQLAPEDRNWQNGFLAAAGLWERGNVAELREYAARFRLRESGAPIGGEAGDRAGPRVTPQNSNIAPQQNGFREGSTVHPSHWPPEKSSEGCKCVIAGNFVDGSKCPIHGIPVVRY